MANLAPSGLLEPGRNCWRIERSQRVGFLIDGAAYFAAVRSAIAQAKRSVFILGWDFDSRMRLLPDGADDGLPAPLGEFLKEVVRRERGLHMYILSWDFAMVFMRDREWRPLYKLGWRTHPSPRIAFRLDDTHPLSGSHHQKVVVVDDTVAFVGGLDLTHGRWDTPAHPRREPLRLDAQGRQSRPNHDVQAVMDGATARALGELCRDRWRRSGGGRVCRLDVAACNDPWPQGLEAEIQEVDVAIARTDPGFVTRAPIDEIHHLYLDAIACARETLYLENQYFSSTAVGAALERRMRGAHAPEVVVVSRLTEEGWLEQRTMGVLRARLHERLRRVSAHERYRLFYPFVPDLDESQLLNVHSKVLVIDDELCSVGSANFNNRSMGFDTECNIAIEARGQEHIRRAIAGLRNRLLAEHLGTQPHELAAALARHNGALIATIESVKGPGRSLRPIDPTVSAEDEGFVPASALIDPERPVDAEKLVMEFVPAEARRPMALRLVRFASALLTLAALAIAWRFTPLHQVLTLSSMLTAANRFAALPFSGVLVMSVYVVGAVLVAPVTLLIILTEALFGPLLGSAYALCGSLLSAAVAYAIGRCISRDHVRWLAGERLNAITSRLARRGVLVIAALRLLPLAPFSVVNAVAGASRVRFRDFMAGTALGLSPAIGITALVVDRVRAVHMNPAPFTWVAVIIVVGMVAVAALLFWRRFR
jgi:phosphatidylserine/phosphatidylglycerophosphate/cardiolipin synthase-like enzyme/uncharacterized membrane protein YdjX (TVP38/TMEM64 family)